MTETPDLVGLFVIPSNALGVDRPALASCIARRRLDAEWRLVSG